MRFAVTTVCCVVLLTACGGVKRGPDVVVSADGSADALADASADASVDASADSSEPAELRAGETALEMRCTPMCDGLECGPDGCGGSCGECPECWVCSASTQHCDPEIHCWPSGQECSTWDGESFGDCPCPTCEETETHCDLDTHTCVEPPPSGCPAIFDCMNECPNGDQDCQQNCINFASIDAQMAFKKLDQCWIDVDLWGCWDLCPDGTEYGDCPDEFHDCIDEKEALCEDDYYA